MSRQRYMEIFLDWFNNFLSVERFAEYYGFSLRRAKRVIKIGRNLHENRVKEIKNGMRPL